MTTRTMWTKTLVEFNGKAERSLTAQQLTVHVHLVQTWIATLISLNCMCFRLTYFNEILNGAISYTVLKYALQCVVL